MLKSLIITDPLVEPVFEIGEKASRLFANLKVELVATDQLKDGTFILALYKRPDKSGRGRNEVGLYFGVWDDSDGSQSEILRLFSVGHECELVAKKCHETLVEEHGLHYMPVDASHYNKARELCGLGAKNR